MIIPLFWAYSEPVDAPSKAVSYKNEFKRFPTREMKWRVTLTMKWLA